MSRFGSGTSGAALAAEAIELAVVQARAAFGAGTPKLAIVFLSVGYPDIADAPGALRAAIGPDVPIVGGTAGGAIFGAGVFAARGVSVVLLGGELDVVCRSAEVTSSELLDVVPIAEEITAHAVAAAGRGFPHHACLVFAPGIFVDGEALVAAVRKGAGAGTQLAGALTGDDLTMDRPAVLDGGELRRDRVVLIGLCSRTPIGVAARHGWRAIGPGRVVTRADGPFLLTLDDRPALDVWLEDAGMSCAEIPANRRDLALHLANHFPLGIMDAPSDPARTPGAAPPRAAASLPSRVDRSLRTRRTPRAARVRAESDSQTELVARTPYVVAEDGTIQLSASVAEGTRLRVLHGSRDDLLGASRDAALAAALRAGGAISGALVLACAGRLAALGDAFPEEPAQIGALLGAPYAGACVFGEIARNVRDVDAFFNTTAVVIAFGTQPR